MPKRAVVDRRKCAYCGACVAVCNFYANELVETYLEIYENCNGCGICVKVCPVEALRLVEV
ncbi:MAG: 4Fe-4S binding protein [Archaeoglobaceae archaeon]|nr:4Fe-4S binding protein [Archaeoglobaceae archaeon]MCX8151985.1 4Fe-4S binding protein [Archaeoglobaceae archaeon]MDW8013374.1 4Fe-4S binding protein [Archaeoglobaceae archaeon]